MLSSLNRLKDRFLGGRRDGEGGSVDELLWHMDLKPHPLGNFSIAVVQANNSLEDQSQIFTSPSATFVGVFDGHGGPDASRFLSENLFPHLHKLASEQGELSKDVIKKAFDDVEEKFLDLVMSSWRSRPQIASVGSCCLVGAIANGLLYVANLGDSRAVLGSAVSGGKKRSEIEAERLTTDHNVGVEEVRKEVEALHPDDSNVVVQVEGVWRIKGISQVSRSIGDVYLKKPEFNGDFFWRQFGFPFPFTRPLMTAEPSIRVRKLRPQDLFLIFASDGLWEQLNDETVVNIVFRSPRVGIAKRLVSAALQEAAKKKEIKYDEIRKIERGRRRHFHDDISVVVIYLDHHYRTFTGRKFGEHSAVNCIRTPVDIFTLNADDAEVALDNNL